MRPRLSYANVISTLALFLALGAGAYAAFHLPRDSVRSKNIVDGQVKGPDLAGRAVGFANLDRSVSGNFILGNKGATRVASETVPAGQSGNTVGLGPVGEIQFTQCASPGTNTPMGSLKYTNTGSKATDFWMATNGRRGSGGDAFASTFQPNANPLGFLLADDNPSIAQVEIVGSGGAGSVGALHTHVWATFRFVSGSCRDSLWVTTEKQDVG